jgi:hypothetical protein
MAHLIRPKIKSHIIAKFWVLLRMIDRQFLQTASKAQQELYSLNH